MDLNDLDVEHLRTSGDRPVFRPDDPGYDLERVGYNLATPQQPAVIVGATSARDVIAAVNFAAAVPPEQFRDAWEPHDYERLAAIKAAYDPANRFRVNVNIPPGPAASRLRAS
jgi:hypothetical protein